MLEHIESQGQNNANSRAMLSKVVRGAAPSASGAERKPINDRQPNSFMQNDEGTSPAPHSAESQIGKGRAKAAM